MWFASSDPAKLDEAVVLDGTKQVQCSLDDNMK